MPGVYEGRCVGCGHEFEAVDDATGVCLDDGTVALLPHPIEKLRIEAHGFTWSEAGRQGRLVSCETIVCEDCGTVGQRQHLAPRLGLFATDAAPIPSFAHWIGGGTAAAVGVWSGSFLLAAAVIVVSVPLAGAAAEALARRRDEAAAGRPYDALRAERAAALRATQRCATCGSAALVSITAARSSGVVIRCPSCGERALTVEVTGIA